MSSNYGVCHICRLATYKPLECEECGRDTCPSCMRGYSNMCKNCYNELTFNQTNEEESEDSKTLHKIDEFIKKNLSAIEKDGIGHYSPYYNGVKMAYNKILAIMWLKNPMPYHSVQSESFDDPTIEEVGDQPVFQGNPDDCKFTHDILFNNKIQNDLFNEKLKTLQNQIDTLFECVRNLH